MKKATKSAGLSIIPVFEEILPATRSQSLPVIPWRDEAKRGRGRTARTLRQRDLVTAFEVACAHIRMLEAQLVALAKAGRSNAL